MKRIEIDGVTYLLYAGGEAKENIWPHMVIAETGETPNGKQRGLLAQYLRDRGITPDPNANTHWYVEAAMKIADSLETVAAPNTVAQSLSQSNISTRRSRDMVPTPSKELVEYYLAQWNTMENYHLQENALDKLFVTLCPRNHDISDILLKASTLNDFYSTNIFSIYPVAKHILHLDVDSRLQAGDVTLVDEMQTVQINGVNRYYYSFATKYCSHHNPLAYPIYDGYVDKMLRYYRNRDRFLRFTASELKSYPRFKEVLLAFCSFYGLEQYNLKQIDKFIWQLGKEYFPKNYGKK